MPSREERKTRHMKLEVVQPNIKSKSELPACEYIRPVHVKFYSLPFQNKGVGEGVELKGEGCLMTFSLRDGWLL